MADVSLFVEVVSADGQVWEGEATQVIARTTEGDLGILPRHEPFLAALVPHAAEVFAADGGREIIAIDGGFISVSDNRVSLLSPYAKIAGELSLEAAEREYREAAKALDEGDVSDETHRHYNRALAQMRAAEKSGQRS